MIRNNHERYHMDRRLPRMRGDDPAVGNFAREADTFAPHARG